VTGRQTSRWVTCPQPRPDAAVRLFCLPYAGGGASSYRLWVAGLPPSIEVCPIQLPGREERLRETPFTNLIDLSHAVSRELTPYLDKPFAFFGHSLGALLAFEVARSLRHGGRPAPLGMYLAAYPAPHRPSARTPIHQLPDPAFIEELRRLQGTPEAVLGNRELIEFLLPILRADFEVCDTYVCAPEPPLACPLYLFGGTEDAEVGAAQLEQWRELTAGAFRLQMLPGTHFFVQSHRHRLLAEIGADLARLM
jgi:medium-chain acyl-[acyl-carrier-protein] hydrolase